ncbi:MAG: hypothetical protein ACKV2V_18585 [Blastocatellia bacterium]
MSTRLPEKHNTKTTPVVRHRHRHENGYVLVAVLAAMTVTLIFIATQVPNLRHDMQREREEEMFDRANQIADAIVRFSAEHGNQFPTSLDQLTELDPIAKSKRYLRGSAKRDPMTIRDGSEGVWKLIRPGDPALRELVLAYIEVMKQPPPGALAQMVGPLPGMQDSGLGGLPSLGPSSKQDEPGQQGLGLTGENGPFIGVASKSKGKLIRYYYGLETYELAPIVAGIPTPGQFIVPPGTSSGDSASTGTSGGTRAPGNPLGTGGPGFNPGGPGGLAGAGPGAGGFTLGRTIFGGGSTVIGGGGANTPRQNDPRCPRGGIPFEVDGRTICTGVLIDGICPPSDPKCRQR